MEAYFQTCINRDVRKLFPRLDSLKFRRFIGVLSPMSGTHINKAAVAFLAACTRQLSSGGRPQHVTLNQALQEYAGSKNRNQLLRLLSPILTPNALPESIRQQVLREANPV
jgi:hypothetical protein